MKKNTDRSEWKTYRLDSKVEVEALCVQSFTMRPHDLHHPLSLSIKAAEWARENGFAVGEIQRNAPRGLMYPWSYYSIGNWRTMSLAEKKNCHGWIVSSYRRCDVLMSELGMHLLFSRKTT